MTRYVVPPNSLNSVLLGIEYAEDILVRSDCFSERTLNLLDDLRGIVQTQVIAEVEL